jgi:hypothetical protein
MCGKALRTATKAYYSHTRDRQPILKQLKWRAADAHIETEVLLREVLQNLSDISRITDTENGMVAFLVQVIGLLLMFI